MTTEPLPQIPTTKDLQTAVVSSFAFAHKAYLEFAHSQETHLLNALISQIESFAKIGKDTEVAANFNPLCAPNKGRDIILSCNALKAQFDAFMRCCIIKRLFGYINVIAPTTATPAKLHIKSKNARFEISPNAYKMIALALSYDFDTTRLIQNETLLMAFLSSELSRFFPLPAPPKKYIPQGRVIQLAPKDESENALKCIYLPTTHTVSNPPRELNLGFKSYLDFLQF